VLEDSEKTGIRFKMEISQIKEKIREIKGTRIKIIFISACHSQ
jgi:hypothetical protein